MLETYLVKITTQAKKQMLEITQYITSELKAPEASLHLLNTLEKAILSLSNFPQRIPLTQEDDWRSQDIRKMTVKNFLIYFIIDKSNMEVHIIAVIYSKRNQLNALSKIEY